MQQSFPVDEVRVTFLGRSERFLRFIDASSVPKSGAVRQRDCTVPVHHNKAHRVVTVVVTNATHVHMTTNPV